MSKSSLPVDSLRHLTNTASTPVLVVSFVALSLGSVAGGLWFTRPPDLSSQVAMLEAKVREDEALIARLQKPASSSTWSHVSGAEANSSISAGAPDMFSAKGPPQGGLGASGASGAGMAPPSATAASMAAGMVPVAKSDKRMAQAEARYSDLINQFGLQPDEKEAFKALAAQRDDIRKNTFAKLSDPSLTTAQRQAVLADGKAQMGQVDGSIRQFLNNDGDYNTFQKWDSQGVERSQMDLTRAIFDQNGVPLTPDQESTLMDRSWALRNNKQGVGDPYSADAMAGKTIDQNYVNSALAKVDADTAVLLQDARSYMSQAQIQSLQAARYQDRVQLEERLWGLARTTRR